MIGWLLLVVGWDCWRRHVPDVLTALGLVGGLTLGVLSHGAWSAVVGLLVGAAVWWLSGPVWNMTLGGGDLKALLALGAWLGAAPVCVVGLLVAPATAWFIRAPTMPYTPCLAVGVLSVLLCR